jgi:hypothetical protein
MSDLTLTAPTAPSRTRGAWTEWRSPVLFSMAAFLIAKVVTEATALVAAYRSHALSVVLHDPTAALTPWAHFDTTYHLLIAQGGYPASHVALAAFPPLPWVIVGAVSAAFHVSPLGAGLLVSAVAEFTALLLLFRLAQIDLGLSGARLTLIALVVYPSALFLTAPYAEPELLGFGVGAFLAARRGHWWLTGLLVAAATLCKLFAIVFVVPMLMEYVQARGIGWRQVMRGAAAVMAPPVLALAGWLAYAGKQFGDPLLPITAERYWSRALAPPWVAVEGAINSFFGRHLVSSFDLVALVLVVAAGVYAFVFLRRSYGVLLMLCAGVFSSATLLESTSRYAVVCFPLFIVVADIARRKRAAIIVWAVVGAPLGLFLIARFATNTWAG